MRCSTDNRRAARVCESPAAPRAGTVAVRRTAGLGRVYRVPHLRIAAAGGGVCELRGAGGDFGSDRRTMAWAGGSQISKGLMSALRISARIPEHPAIVFSRTVTRRRRCAATSSRSCGRRDRPARDHRGRGRRRAAPDSQVRPHGAPDRTLGSGGRDAGAPARIVRPGSAGLGRVGRRAPAGSEHLSSLKQSHLRELAALTGLGYVRLQRRPTSPTCCRTNDAREASRCRSMRAHRLRRLRSRFSFCGSGRSVVADRDRAPAAG